MAKLTIIYRTEDDDKDYFKGNTYYSFLNDLKTTTISIAPNETRKLADIIYGVGKKLQNGFNLQKDEKFEIEKIDKTIMDMEKDKHERVNNLVCSYVKRGYQAVLEGKTTLEEIINMLEKEGVAND